MVAAAAVVFTVAAPATAAPEKCRAAIIKAGAAFAQAKAKALAKCEEAIVKGKRPPGDCHADPKVGPAIAKADAKLRSTITKACAGKDKTCGSSDDAALGDVGWNIGTCPNFANGACDGSITSCADIATCVACIVEAATDEAIAISYDTFVASDPKAQKELNKCQVAIGKATAAFFVAKSKALAKCWTKVNANKATNPCPVPGDGKAAAAIAKAETKRRATICKACGGADKLCNGVGDLTPAAIGFLSQCPDVAAPGGASCAGAVTVLADLVDCIECVNEHAVDCADRSTVPAFVSPYPAECNPVIAPTPTVTETPTPTDDATPTASPTPSETATPEPTPTETATPEPTPSETATPEPTPTETATPEPTPTESATPEPTPTETATPEPTPTESATPEPTPTESATPTPMPTATGELMDAIVSIPTLGDYWGIDVDSTAQNPPSSLPRQRVSNGDALEIVELKVCLGRALGTETGTIHFEIWSDKTTGCEVGAPGCPDEKLGDDSDSFSVDDLATMSGTPSGACGDPGNGQEVTITWSGDTPKPMGSFWIVGVNDSPGGIEDGQVRWGASAVGIVDVHADTDYDSWKVSDTVDNNNDFYFVVRTP